MFQIKSTSKNYLAKIVKIENIRKHGNTDKLQIVSVDGNNCITDLAAKTNECYYYTKSYWLIEYK